MNSFSLPLALFVMVSQTFAAGGESAPPLSASVQNGRIVISAPEGHHFNLKAPAEASAYICDDAKSYCVKRTVRVDKATGSEETAPAVAAKIVAPTRSASSIGAKQARRFGFIHNDGTRALAEAQKSGKPLLIDFFGIWCPPCNQLDENVFNKPEYKKLARGFITVKLDADDEASWELKQRYKVTGYPTVIFAKSDGTEIHRIIGYIQPQAFFRAMAAAQKGEKPPVLATGEALPDPEKQAPEAVIASSKAWLEKGLPEDAELQPTDLWQIIAEAEKKRGNEPASKAAYAEAVKLYRKQIAKLRDGSALNRGYNLELAYCMAEAGDDNGAIALYRSLEKQYPREFTFFYAHGRLLQRRGRAAEGLPLAERAVQYGYGDNRLRAALLQAQLLAALHKNSEARAVIEQTLAATKAPTDPDNRTHRYLKQLREARDSLAQN
jgi:thiol-disulfide isomerase/thioredoxin